MKIPKGPFWKFHRLPSDDAGIEIGSADPISILGRTRICIYVLGGNGGGFLAMLPSLFVSSTPLEVKGY